MTALEIINKYIAFFEKRGHKRIENSPLVPQNDPTTLFTSSGMQPLVPYLLGETHPMGKRLVNVQNCFRAVDIEEVGDNRHTTFFRMLGNWSLGEYFKKEEILWLWELLTKEFKLPKEKLYITVFRGSSSNKIDPDNEAFDIWTKILTKENLDPENRIFFGDVDKNWWSRSGIPNNMPVDELGGPDTEVYFKFDEIEHTEFCEGKEDNPILCECGKYLEIGNSVFMQYKKTENGFVGLPQKNIDYGGGLERLLAAIENKSDIFQTSLFMPIIRSIEGATTYSYEIQKKNMRIIADHFTAAAFLISAGIKPSKTEQGYILRRLLRRGFDSFHLAHGVDISSVIEKIVEQYSQTNETLKEKYEEIKNTILEEQRNYENTIRRAKKMITIQQHIQGKARIISASDAKSNISNKTIENLEKLSDEIKGVRKISADDAFTMYATHGLSPTQIKSLGYTFNDQEFAEKMKFHQNISRTGAVKKFAGGLADHSEKTIMGHTATHLLHQALRDILGATAHQTGSNITPERVRFDFNFDRNLIPEELKKIEIIVNQKIKESLPVHFEILPLQKAKEIGAIGLFDEKYSDKVKVYFVGDYSREFCGGPHVTFTSEIKSFKIIKQENIGKGNRRIYAKVG